MNYANPENLRQPGGGKPVRASKVKSKLKIKKSASEFDRRVAEEITGLRAKQAKFQNLIDSYGDEKVDFALYLEKQIEVVGRKIALIEELQEL